MKYNQHFPVAIALTKEHGWQTIYEGTQCRGVTFESVFWLREPSEELGIMVDTCVNTNSDCIQMQNLLIPDIFRTIVKLNTTFDLNAKKNFFTRRTKNDSAQKD
tara:strand:+ start:506 stop:817 length:312 start_codon:yes stop_codon:yes gene_type:complete